MKTGRFWPSRWILACRAGNQEGSESTKGFRVWRKRGAPSPVGRSRGSYESRKMEPSASCMRQAEQEGTLPVAVEHDEPRGTDEVETGAAAFGTQQEDEGLRLGSAIEAVDHLLAFDLRSRAAAGETSSLATRATSNHGAERTHRAARTCTCAGGGAPR
jgi:hypothetical protein